MEPGSAVFSYDPVTVAYPSRAELRGAVTVSPSLSSLRSRLDSPDPIRRAMAEPRDARDLLNEYAERYRRRFGGDYPFSTTRMRELACFRALVRTWGVRRGAEILRAAFERMGGEHEREPIGPELFSANWKHWQDEAWRAAQEPEPPASQMLDGSILLR